jgi:hypothetical protein
VTCPRDTSQRLRHARQHLRPVTRLDHTSRRRRTLRGFTHSTIHSTIHTGTHYTIQTAIHSVVHSTIRYAIHSTIHGPRRVLAEVNTEHKTDSLACPPVYASSMAAIYLVVESYQYCSFLVVWALGATGLGNAIPSIPSTNSINMAC